ncbi:matrix metalloproteinase-19-like [Ptychodera flava]|uniref:matrix metalloproteinase-19-like n=1 Tax=Ptychodera flava TaxID=63121 RepID=UPI003969E0F1
MLRPWYIILVFSVVCLLEVGARPTMNATNYLMSFGYLQPSGENGDGEMRDAVMNFQRMANLEMTGDLNDATMQMMEKPRCGVEDMIGSAVMGTNTNDTDNTKFMPRLKRYALSSVKWSKTDLTYKYVSFTEDLSIADQKAAIERAFKHWADVTPLSFTEVNGGEADILIEFAAGVHSDGFAAKFDGPGGVLAHAYFPESGDAHFDDDETFTVNSHEGINLDFVAAHEFGHSLGLAHSSVPGALMAPFYSGYDPDFSLPQDDISGIQALYGELEADEDDSTDDMVMETPDACNTTFDTVFMDGRENTYVTKGGYIWLVLSNGVAENYPKKIGEVYPGLPNDITAAFTSPWTHRTFFFKGRRIWRYTGQTLDEGYPKRTDNTGLPRRPDGVFVWSGDGKIYVFKGSRYYIWNEFTEKVYPGAVRRIRKHWRGLPKGIDAAFQWKNRRTYFFKDGEYWRYDDLAMEVEAGYPKSTARWWIGCEEPVRRRD